MQNVFFLKASHGNMEIFYMEILFEKSFYWFQRYTNADLKICQYLRFHVEIIC